MKKIVVIGGGTGTSTLLTGLRKFDVELSAIVSMADNGGSTGILRRELGVMPPGDIRQCLLALSHADDEMKKLVAYRFDQGSLKGQNCGNLILAALEKSTGNFESALKFASEYLKVEGQVLPITLDDVNIKTQLTTGETLPGESSLHQANLKDFDHQELEPIATLNPRALDAINEADTIIFAPGDFYSSVAPNFLVKGLPEAVRASQAKVIYIANLVTKAGHTDGWTVERFVEEIELRLQGKLDHVIYNNKLPSVEIFERYTNEGEKLVTFDPKNMIPPKYVGDDHLEIISKGGPKKDLIVRSNIRHNPDLIAKAVFDFV
ncbi:MAG: gluconeogenesis factor YvcK family protein [Patescibacteria group bacterium]